MILWDLEKMDLRLYGDEDYLCLSVLYTYIPANQRGEVVDWPTIILLILQNVCKLIASLDIIPYLPDAIKA